MAPHFEDSSLIIHKIKCGPYDNNAYLLVCPETDESIIIDTPQDPEKLIEAAKSTAVKSILITHNHFDHIRGFTEVASALGAPVGIGESEARVLPKTADFLLEDGQEVIAGTVALKAIHTPGHTQGSTCLVTGKHLFPGGHAVPWRSRKD